MCLHNAVLQQDSLPHFPLKFPSSLPYLLPSYPPLSPSTLPSSFLPSQVIGELSECTLADAKKINLWMHQRKAMAWMLWREGETPSGGILGECLEPAWEWAVHVA